MSNMNLADAMSRAKVLDIDLQKQLWKYMKDMVPLPGIYNSSFVASNQDARANNVIKGTKREQVNKIAQDIRYGLFTRNPNVNCIYISGLVTSNQDERTNNMIKWIMLEFGRQGYRVQSIPEST